MQWDTLGKKPMRKPGTDKPVRIACKGGGKEKSSENRARHGPVQYLKSTGPRPTRPSTGTVLKAER
jgi:hypothetical protein